MNNSVRYCFFVCLFLFLTAAGYADILDDYEIQLAKVANDYRESLSAKESRFAKTYEKNMDELCRLSKQLQLAVVKAGFGPCFSFDQLSNAIRKLYAENGKLYEKYEMNRGRKQKSGKKNNRGKKKNDDYLVTVKKNSPAPLLKLLADDLKILRKMEFSAVTGKISPELESQKEICIFQCSFHFFVKNRKNYSKGPKAFQDEFDHRCQYLSTAAQKASRYIAEHNENAELSCNLVQEINFLFKKYQALRFGRSPDVNRDHKEISTSIHRIDQALSSLENTGAGHKPKKKYTAQKKKELEETPEETLRQNILSYRDKVYRENTMIDGLDKDTLRRFQATFSRKEREIFEKAKKECMENGYTREAAEKNAVGRIRHRKNLSADRKELIQINARIEKEKIRDENEKMK